MKAKIGVLLASVSVWQKLQTQSVPFKAAYLVNKFLRKLDRELEFPRAELNKLGDEYRKEDTSLTRKAELEVKYTELLETEIEINFEPLSEDIMANYSLSIAELMAIEYAVVQE